jgi:hypothetical protein
MKHIYLLLLFCLPFCSGCKHQSHEFAVICDFSPVVYGNLVLITNDEGKVIEEVPVEPGSLGLVHRFLTPNDDPDAVFGVHLLGDYSFDGSGYFNNDELN